MRTQLLQSSDLNTATKPSIVARKYVYADLDLLFQPNPVTGDINPIKDVDAVKKAIINLVMTNQMERPFQPEIGSGIRALLFEPADPITMHDIEHAIRMTVENFEPRVKLWDVQVIDNSDQNEYHVTITFQIISNEQVGSATLILERLR